ncbi:MAG: FecR domain-containing protein [Burkholderiales bacterium]|nr:FecR domain-containing protein [Burkholderiales bacterium]
MKKYLSITALVLCLATSSAWAAVAGTVTQLAGVLTAQRSDGGAKILALQSSVESGDLLATGNNSYARIKFTDGGDMTLRPNTQLRIEGYQFQQEKPQEDNAFFRLVKGGLRAVTGLVGKRNGLESYKVATPTATIGIRGTDWGALFCENDCGGYTNNSGKPPAPGLYVDVVSGKIIVTNGGGAQEFSPGQFGFIGGLQTPPIILPPNNGVPISTDKGLNKPPESVLGNQPNQKDFQCTIDG